MVHRYTKIPWTHGDTAFNVPGRVKRFFAANSLRPVRVGVVDCPPWPDSLGFRDVRLHRMPSPKIFLPVGPTMGAARVLEVVCSVLPFEPPLTRSRVLMLSKNWGYSIEKARKELGYCPRVRLDDGIRRTARWYQEKGYV